MDKWEDVIKLANEKLAEGYGPAWKSNDTFIAIPGKKTDRSYYAIIVNSNGKPVDWYCESEDPNIVGGFGGWYRKDYNEFIESNLWVDEIIKEIQYYAQLNQ